MIKVTADMTTEELEALLPAGATHFRFTADGTDEPMKPLPNSKLNTLEGTEGSLEFGKGVKNFVATAIDDEKEEEAEKPKKPAKKKGRVKKELSAEEQEAKEAKEMQQAKRRQKLEVIDSMLAPVGFDFPPTREVYKQQMGEGAEIGLAEFPYNTDEIIKAVVDADLEDKIEDEDEEKYRFRIMKNIQARKFNLSKAEKVAGYKVREREVSARSIPAAKIVAFFQDDDMLAKLTDEQKQIIISRLGK